MEALNLGKLSRYAKDWSIPEVDFVILPESEVISIEVKSGENLKPKSFRLFCEKDKPSEAIST